MRVGLLVSNGAVNILPGVDGIYILKLAEGRVNMTDVVKEGQDCPRKDNWY